MKHLIPAMTLISVLCGINPYGKASWLTDFSALPSAEAKSVSGMPKKLAAPGKKWVQRTLKGAPTGQWIQVWDKPIVPKTGPAASAPRAPRGSEIVGDHWHWPDDYMAVLHGERWGRAGRLGTWKVKVRKVP